MNFNTREFPTPPIRLNASRKPGTLTIQPSNRSLSRKTSTVSLPSGMIPSTSLISILASARTSRCPTVGPTGSQVEWKGKLRMFRPATSADAHQASDGYLSPRPMRQVLHGRGISQCHPLAMQWDVPPTCLQRPDPLPRTR